MMKDKAGKVTCMVITKRKNLLNRLIRINKLLIANIKKKTLMEYIIFRSPNSLIVLKESNEYLLEAIIVMHC